MDFDKQKIFEKIVKLRALGTSDNQNESASALAHAARLMAKYEIEEAELDVGDGKDEEILNDANLEGDEESVFKGGRVPSWRGQLASVCAKATGCYVYRTKRDGGWRLAAVGQRLDLARYRTLYFECAGEVDRLTTRLANGQGRNFANSFRLGCVSSIASAIREELRELREEMRGTVSETALVVVDTKTKDARATLGLLSAGRNAHSNLNSAAYSSGQAAGRSVYGQSSRRKVTT